MNTDEIVYYSKEYAKDAHILDGAPLQAVKGKLLEWLQKIDNTVDNNQLNSAIDIMQARGILLGYDGTFLIFAGGDDIF